MVALWTDEESEVSKKRRRMPFRATHLPQEQRCEDCGGTGEVVIFRFGVRDAHTCTRCGGDGIKRRKPTPAETFARFEQWADGKPLPTPGPAPAEPDLHRSEFVALMRRVADLERKLEGVERRLAQVEGHRPLLAPLARPT